MRTLAVVAHPDDEVLGCGGTLARLASEGHDVHVGILGEGITSRSDRDKFEVDRALQSLKASAESAAEVLGVKSLRLLEFPDNRFDTVPLLDVVRVIEGWIEELKPTSVYTHHPSDLNVDHSIVHRAVLTATRPTKGHPVTEVLTFAVSSSTEWAFPPGNLGFRPDVFVDVTETLEAKLRAMELYESEVRPFPHPRSREALTAEARKWGSVVGREAAEAFELVRSIR